VGTQERLAALKRFYFGQPEQGVVGLTNYLADTDAIDAKGVSTMAIPGTETVARVGRYGPYLERPSDGKRANLPADFAPDELTAAKAEELIERGSLQFDVGTHPETGLQLVAKEGRYGPYITEVLPEDAPAKSKARTASLFQGMTLDTVTLEQAVQLLSLPRIVGTDPATGEDITAQNGRYGPYLKKGTDSRTLASEEQLLTITLEEALAVYAQPKRGRGAAALPGTPLGTDPATGLTIEVRKGRFGPYVTDGEYNATLKEPDTADNVSLERAAALLTDKRAAGPPAKKRGAAKKTAAKKTAAKKTAAKKTAAKKAAAEKTAAKKTAAENTAAEKTAATPADPSGADVPSLASS
jgi:DNA topoisomerase-1